MDDVLLLKLRTRLAQNFAYIPFCFHAYNVSLVLLPPDLLQVAKISAKKNSRSQRNMVGINEGKNRFNAINVSLDDGKMLVVAEEIAAESAISIIRLTFIACISIFHILGGHPFFFFSIRRELVRDPCIYGSAMLCLLMIVMHALRSIIFSMNN